MTASGGRAAAAARASAAVAAVSTTYPAPRSLSWSARRICGSSSTTRMRAPLTSRRVGAPRRPGTRARTTRPLRAPTPPTGGRLACRPHRHAAITVTRLVVREASPGVPGEAPRPRRLCRVLRQRTGLPVRARSRRPAPAAPPSGGASRRAVSRLGSGPSRQSRLRAGHRRRPRLRRQPVQPRPFRRLALRVSARTERTLSRQLVGRPSAEVDRRSRVYRPRADSRAPARRPPPPRVWALEDPVQRDAACSREGRSGAGGWRGWGGYARFRAAGCYGIQVDGTSFSEVIVFKAVITRRFGH
jgi:hypothetical protein